MQRTNFDPEELFSMYMKVTGVPTLEYRRSEVPELNGKTLGIVNGSSWITLWSNYFGGQFLPGVKLVNVGNEAVQLNFMQAHKEGKKCPPQINIDKFVQYAKDVYALWSMDALIITCSTMNRAANAVVEAMKPFGVPVIQIDEPMMEAAVNTGGKTLVIATHGPTVKSTQALLQETAQEKQREIDFTGTTVEECFELLGEGNIREHNRLIAEAIRNVQTKEKIDSVVLAQLSMTVFVLTYPDPQKEFGIPVFTSGECGFQRVKDVLMRKA